MSRARYSPPTPEVAARIKKVVDLYRRQAELEAEYKAGLAELADPEGAAVPIAYLAAELDVERKTVYRHLGRRMT